MDTSKTPHGLKQELGAFEPAAPQSTEIFRLLVDAVEDYAIFALDPHGYIQTWNLGGTRIKGYGSEEVIGSHFSRFYTPADIERHHPAFELRVAAEEGKYEEEGWRVRKDGTMFWANVTITAMRDKSRGGELKGFAKVTRDLTARRQSEEALRQSQERYRLLVDNITEYAFILLDAKGRVTSWNAGATVMTGYEAYEILGSHYAKLYPPAEMEAGKPAKDLREAIVEGKFEEESARVRKDGGDYWVSVVITCLKDDSGNVRGFSVVARDNTAKKRAENLLRQSEERFRMIVDSVEDYAVFMLTPEGDVATWNKGAERSKGYSASEIVGLHFSKFYPEEDVLSGKPALELIEARKLGKFEDEGWRIRKDGSRFWANVVITAMRNEDGALIGFSKVTRDLTERKRFEDNLRRAYSELEHRIEVRTRELSIAKAKAEEAVKARDQFFSIASHELKTPISSLKLQSQLRKRSVARGDFSEFAPTELLRLCEDDDRQVGRLAFLVDNMLDISKLTSGNFALSPEAMSLDEAVAESVKSMEAILKESGNECRLMIEEKIRLQLDRHRIEQVLTNLLSNAGKYAPGKPIDVSLSREGDFAVLRIRDYGQGIPENSRERIFAPFERMNVDAGVGGLGLGLYIVKQIVEAHGGRIELESTAGNGATFVVRLPINEKGSEGNNE